MAPDVRRPQKHNTIPPCPDISHGPLTTTTYYSKNYRKPLLQRYVVRILLMYSVPILRFMSSALNSG